MRKSLIVCRISDVMDINLFGKELENWMQLHMWKLGWTGVIGSLGMEEMGENQWKHSVRISYTEFTIQYITYFIICKLCPIYIFISVKVIKTCHIYTHVCIHMYVFFIGLIVRHFPAELTIHPPSRFPHALGYIPLFLATSNQWFAFCNCRIVLSFLEFHINGILFCVLLLLFNVFLRLVLLHKLEVGDLFILIAV